MMRWREAAFGLVVLLALPPASVPRAQGLNPAFGVVLPESAAAPMRRPRLCNRPMPWPIEGTWTPEPGVVTRLESALAGALASAIDRAPAGRYPKPDVSGFYRQYLGLVIAGKRIVYINGLHEQLVKHGQPGEWQTVAWNGCDGGLAAFGAEYHLETERVENVIFNGGGRGEDE